MATDDGAETPTDLPTEPLIHVDVPRETAEQAVRLADEFDLAMEDALHRLTAYDYPVDVVPAPAGEG